MCLSNFKFPLRFLGDLIDVCIYKKTEKRHRERLQWRARVVPFSSDCITFAMLLNRVAV